MNDDLGTMAMAIIMRASQQTLANMDYSKPFLPQFEEHLDKYLHRASRSPQWRELTGDDPANPMPPALYSYGELREALEAIW